MIAALLLPADTRERHRLVAELAGEAASALDVGGAPGLLHRFMPHTRVTTANVEAPADFLLSGIELPFANGAFDLVTSVDVLEHLAPADRAAHVQELVRVARATVVLCCPLGGREHAESERRLAGWYRETAGTPHRFLEEHARHGLPTEDELRRLATMTDLPAELWFHGDFRRVEAVFRLGVMARRRPTPRVLLRYLRAAWRQDPSGLDRTAGRWTNRAFLVLHTTSR